MRMHLCGSGISWLLAGSLSHLTFLQLLIGFGVSAEHDVCTPSHRRVPRIVSDNTLYIRSAVRDSPVAELWVILPLSLILQG